MSSSASFSSSSFPSSSPSTATTTATTLPSPGHTPRRAETPYDIAASVISHLRAREQTLAVAESLTAGLVMATITGVPGASSAFRGGVVSYATPLKASLLGVDRDLIAREGVIHADVAAQMAAGARKAASIVGEGGEADWGVGTTGVAGPDMQDGKPVGTVYIGVASRSGSRAFGPFMFPGSRDRVREATVLEALARLREVLLEEHGVTTAAVDGKTTQ
ncbi:hypothetical protein VTJ83DRAFT_248 [Remersonia thermophila]|uniref:CinA C-terminal domain-containing protein n=1 Tax=Remersonia thermophila TaxID=72144 RepID=A0ABR4DKN6_9PEZI